MNFPLYVWLDKIGEFEVDVDISESIGVNDAIRMSMEVSS